MTTTAERAVNEAMTLNPAQRAFVAEKLIENLDLPDTPPLSVAWKEEVRRRCAHMDRETIDLDDAEKVFARAYSSLT